MTVDAVAMSETAGTIATIRNATANSPITPTVSHWRTSLRLGSGVVGAGPGVESTRRRSSYVAAGQHESAWQRDLLVITLDMDRVCQDRKRPREVHVRIGVSLSERDGPDALDMLTDDLRRAADDGFASAWMSNIFGLDALTALARVSRLVRS